MCSHLSYVHVPHSCPMEATLLHELFDSVAEQQLDKEALITYDMNMTRTSVTFREFRDRSILLASSLLDLGLSRGHRVLLIGASSIRYAVTIMALHRVGANVILLGPGGMTEDKVEKLSKLDLKAIIFDPAMDQSQIEQLQRGVHHILDNDEQQAPLVLVTLGKDESIKEVFSNSQNGHSYEGLIHLGKGIGVEKLLAVQENLQVDDPHATFFTSGSTGSPKMVQCVMHQHTSGLATMVRLFDYVEQDTYSGQSNEGSRYFDRPMAWSGGYFMLVHGVITGCTLVWVPTQMGLQEETSEMVFKILKKEKCYMAIFGVALIRKLASEQLQRNYDLSYLKVAGIGGQRYSMTQIEDLFNCLPHVKVVLAYGSTESGGLFASATYTKDQLTVEEYGKMDISSGVEVKVVDEEGKIVPRGREGEICVRSQFTFLEYLGNPAATKQAKSPTGWLYLGDIGKMDEKGRVEVLGRTKEFIKRATVKIFPAEIESVLATHPLVADVMVVGVPDKWLHEEICACVILKDEESGNTEARLAELEAWCAQQWPPGADGLSLKPKYFVPIRSFSWGGTGKVDGKGVREAAMKYLGIV